MTGTKRGSGHKTDPNQVFGPQHINSAGKHYLSPTILAAAARSPRNRRNSLDGTAVQDEKWLLMQKDQRAETMNPDTKHNVDMIGGVFKMLDNDGSNFIDMVELQRVSLNIYLFIHGYITYIQNIRLLLLPVKIK